ncbi:glycosyltransferase family 2 protein [Rhizobium pusense]|nr:glycosyltransferase family A protein [Agrobacterium pusense]MDH2092511.1 glycosyltransferase family 2 protein [Agrobacterium pusense]
MVFENIDEINADIVLFSSQIIEHNNLSSGFHARIFDGKKKIYKKIDLNEYINLNKNNGCSTVAFVVTGNFVEWETMFSVAGDLILNVHLIVPGSSGALSSSCLSQLSTELAIRFATYGYKFDVNYASCHMDKELAGSIVPAVYTTSLGTFLSGLLPLQQDMMNVLSFNTTARQPDLQHKSRPTFTVLTRTQGKRLETLQEVFLCLSAQTYLDFEHLVIAHNADDDAIRHIKHLIDNQPSDFRNKIRFERVEGGTRTTPLNIGFSIANGLYVVILDDDDIVFAHWLETFAGIAARKPGALLRAVALRQEFTWATVNGKRAARAISGMYNDYGPDFDFIQHLETNLTPPVSIAFPRYLFAEHGLRFDEALTTTEDWDYIMRCAAYVGVGVSDQITCIYRWWIAAESSREMHSQDEWILNHEVIQNRLNSTPVLLESRSIKTIRNISSKRDEFLRWANSLHHEIEKIKIAEEAVLPPNTDGIQEPRLTKWENLINKKFYVDKKTKLLRRTIIEDSGLFDADWYQATYSDVAQSGVDPLTHFLDCGSRELRSPCKAFNAKAYYVMNRDVQSHRIEPVFHYLLHGKWEGRPLRSHES